MNTKRITSLSLCVASIIVTGCADSATVTAPETRLRATPAFGIGTAGSGNRSDPTVIPTDAQSVHEPSSATATDSTDSSAFGLGWMGGGH